MMTQSRFQKGPMPWERTPNMLLTKSELGKSKPTVRDLPPDEYVYGQRVPYGPEDSNQVMYNWKYHEPTSMEIKQKDLRKTNKDCVANNLHTASQFYEFRKTHSSMGKSKRGTKDIPIYLPHDGFTYGKPGDLEDPIRIVMGNAYGEDDATRRRSFYTTQSWMRDSHGSKKLSCHITKNHWLVKEATKEKLERLQWRPYNDQWKLSKFKGIPGKCDHRRDKDPFATLKEQQKSKEQDQQRDRTQSARPSNPEEVR